MSIQPVRVSRFLRFGALVSPTSSEAAVLGHLHVARARQVGWGPGSDFLGWGTLPLVAAAPPLMK